MNIWNFFSSYVLDEILSSKQRDVIVENIHEYLRNCKSFSIFLIGLHFSLHKLLS